MAGSARGTTRNAGVSIGLVAGAPCRCAAPEELVRPSVVSLVRSWVSECLWAAPDGSERMVFRVGSWGARAAAPWETRERRWHPHLVFSIGARHLRSTWGRRWCRWCVPVSLRVRSRSRMGRNAWSSALGGGRLGSRHHEKRGSVDRALGWCSPSVRSPGGACGTVGGVAGAFLGL